MPRAMTPLSTRLACLLCRWPSSERSISDNADHEMKLLMMYTRASFYAMEPSNAAAYAPVEACGAHEWSYIAHGWRAGSAACSPESDASAHGQEGGAGGILTEGGLPRHASAHGQEGGALGTLTEGGPPRHASARGQEGGGGGDLTEGGHHLAQL